VTGKGTLISISKAPSPGPALGPSAGASLSLAARIADAAQCGPVPATLIREFAALAGTLSPVDRDSILIAIGTASRRWQSETGE
jgi:hypothetical protein